uniref:Uncharacterized protein n=1 Tax=Manihot esculenta TaxID=3983 RepID=A0A2C9V870_MANES
MLKLLLMWFNLMLRLMDAYRLMSLGFVPIMRCKQNCL